jgi:putative transposase
MTIARMYLAELIVKGSDADLLKEMLTFVVNSMLDLDVESPTGAAYGEQSARASGDPVIVSFDADSLLA